MYLDVYIGDLDDPHFDWNDDLEKTLCPTRDSPFFPNGYFANRAALKYFKDQKIEWKQHDWGAYVAKMTQQQIEQMVKEIYKDNWYSWLEQLLFLKQFIDRLDSRKQYAVVASEL